MAVEDHQPAAAGARRRVKLKLNTHAGGYNPADCGDSQRVDLPDSYKRYLMRTSASASRWK